MANVQVVHSSDLAATSFKVNAEGKLEIVKDKRGGVVYEDVEGAQAAAYKPVRILWAAGQEITFDDLRNQFQAALAAVPDMTYFELVSNGYGQGLVKSAFDGGWDITLFYPTSGANGMMYPEARIVNGAIPLFIDKMGNPNDKVAGSASNYNLEPQHFMNLEEGASAVWEPVVPVKLRSLEIITQVRVNGYIQPHLKALVEYADGTTFDSTSYPYNNNWYMGEVLDQSKRVSKVTWTMLANASVHTADSVVSTAKLDTATGTLYTIDNAAAPAGCKPVQSIAYVNGYNIDGKARTGFIRGRPEGVVASVKNRFVATSSAAAAAGTSTDNMLDGDSATFYRMGTTGNSLTLTATLKPGEVLNALHRVVLHIDVPTGEEAIVKSITSVVVATQSSMGNGNATSNTRHFRIQDADIASGKLVLSLFAGFPNTYPDPVDRITVVIAKSVAGSLQISELEIHGL